MELETSAFLQPVRGKKAFNKLSCLVLAQHHLQAASRTTYFNHGSHKKFDELPTPEKSLGSANTGALVMEARLEVKQSRLKGIQDGALASPPLRDELPGLSPSLVPPLSA